MEKFSYLKSANAAYIDDLFAQYLQNPDSVDASWRYFFDGIEVGGEIEPNGHAIGAPAASAAPGAAGAAGAAAASGVDFSAEAKVADLINAYRAYGRLLADINPLTAPPSSRPQLDLSHFGLTEADLGRTFQAGKFLGLGPSKLSDILALLKQTYCGSIGVEYTHIGNSDEREWLQKKMEASRNRDKLDAATRQFILKRLTESETFERFLHQRYAGKKRFSIEGGESVIPGLDCIIEEGAELGAKEFVMGMAHRGRLNVLTNIFGKKPEYILTQFEDAYKHSEDMGEGDVKYHMGYSADFTTRKGKAVHLSLASNPSHLEFVNPVVEGMARAKQTFLGDGEGSQVMPILIHGDAAFAGQGVCYETLNFELLPGFRTGGTLHIVINNQVGFTTAPRDSRSTTYCTDLAKMLEVPIFHVNGDDPEAVWYVCRLSTEYRQRYKKDAIIDLVCYRKHGHNEGDEPAFTQPLMYKKIKAHASTRELYAQKLAADGVLTADGAQKLVDDVMARLSEAQARTRTENPQPYVSVFEGRWKGLKRGTEEDAFVSVKTQVPAEKLRELATKINTMPPGFHLNPKLVRVFEPRLKAIQDGHGIDWGNAETLAYATLVDEGVRVRLTGQDAERGTFTHRHAVVTDSETGETYNPVARLSPPGKNLFEVYNSHLSETAVMGFEYGFSLADPSALVIWEAQFGDFANGAQVIIDQFLTTSESKWQRMSGLTLLLPHGYEGAGPEHSSARLERFLQLCGRNNIIVANLSTPAQIFHALRRQVKRDFRKPLVIMSPKKLLRFAEAVSSLSDLTDAGFREVIDDSAMSGKAASGVKRVVLCSGKVYYDLTAERAAKKRDDVAIVRVEQLYPWPGKQLAAILKNYAKAKDIVWVQEEPRNMGAWTHVFNLWAGGTGNFAAEAGGRGIRYVGRPIGAAPAVGSEKASGQEQKTLVETAISGD